MRGTRFACLFGVPSTNEHFRESYASRAEQDQSAERNSDLSRRGCSRSWLRLFVGLTLTGFWLSLGGLTLAAGCTPSQTRVQAVNYTPIEREDWPVSTPSKQGIDPTLVAELYSDASELETLLGLLVIKDDQLIAEKYFNGSSIDHVNDRMSTTKSFVSAATGKALELGCLKSLDEKMIRYFPHYADKIQDPRKAQISVRQMLQMRSGYPWEGREAEYNHAIFVEKNYNWEPHLVDFALLSPPGTKFAYSNVTSHLLGAVVSNACETDLLTFTQQQVLDPLGAKAVKWHRATDGHYFGAFGLFITARDMAKFGSLYLHAGEFRGKRVLPEAWVRDSLKRYSEDINFTGWISSKLGSYFSDVGYGCQWWSATADEHYVDFAWGHGGNLIVLVHDLNMIVVSAADPLYDYPEEHGWKYEGAVIDVVGKFIASLPESK